MLSREVKRPADLIPGEPQYPVVKHVTCLVRQLVDEDLQTQVPLHGRLPVRCGEVMVLFQFPEETLIRHAVFLQELLAHLAVKGGDEM